MNGLSDTDFGLIGYPLGHSFSKSFFTQLFAEDGSSRSYGNFELKELTPETLWQLFLLNPKLKGFNVTAPYKVKIMEFLDSADATATAVGAVNTVKIRRADDGRLLGLDGYNTDVAGFRYSLTEMLGGERPESALVLGTGGAAKAVGEALRGMGIAHKFVSRTKKNAETILYSDIDKATVEANRIIINATPTGTYPNVETCPPFPYEYLSEANFCHDLVYNPDETLFMKKAAEAGAKVKNGLEMLFMQAIESLKIWTSN